MFSKAFVRFVIVRKSSRLIKYCSLSKYSLYHVCFNSLPIEKKIASFKSKVELSLNVTLYPCHLFDRNYFVHRETQGYTDTRMDGQCYSSIPPKKNHFAGGIIICRPPVFLKTNFSYFSKSRTF